MLFCNAFSSKVIICQLSCYIIVSAVLCSEHNQSMSFVGPISPDELETHDCQYGVAGCSCRGDRNFQFPRSRHLLLAQEPLTV